MSDNGPPFNGKEFSTFLTGLGIRHTTSSPNYLQSNGFIERQIQMLKRLMKKATCTERSFMEALTGLRAQPLGNGLPSPSEILHGWSLVTRKATPVDVVAVRQSLIALQVKYTKSYDKARQAKIQQALVIGEEVYFLSGKNQWQIGTVTGTRDTGRSYDILTGKGTSLRRNRSHLKPRSFDIPIIAQYFTSRTSTPSKSEITKTGISGPQHPPKVIYFYNNEHNISFQDHCKQHPPKVKYLLKTVPKLVIRCIRDIVYDSDISETLVPLKSAIKIKKQMRFAGDPVTSQDLTVMQTCLRKLRTKWELNPTTRRPVTVVLIPGPQHPPKVKYFLVTITDLISAPTHPRKVKYQITMQTVNQAAGKLQDHHHQSLAILQQGCCTHPSLKWQ